MKRFLTLVVLLTTLHVAGNAQLINAIKKAIPIYASGMITYKDGHQEEFLWVELPKDGSTSIKVSNDPNHKKPKSLKANDIRCITYWTTQMPEQRLTLYRVHADKYRTIPVDVWGYPIASSEWGTVYKCNTSYEVDKKTGEIVLIYLVSSGGMMMASEIPARCYLVCKDFTNAQIIGASPSHTTAMNWFSWSSKRVAPIFASNASVAERIAKKELGSVDIQFILDEMTCSHAAKSAKSAKKAKTNSVETSVNGTVGDDE